MPAYSQSVAILALVLAAGCNPSALLISPKTGFFVQDGKCVCVTVHAAPGSRPMTRTVGADPESFQAIPPHPRATKGTLEYAKDADTVFVGALTRPYVLQVCDPKTFKILSPDGKYACDSSHVYYCGIPLTDADPATFQILQPPYSKDSKHAFAGAVAIRVQDPATFEVVVPGDSEFPLIQGYQRLNEREHIKPKTGIWGWARDKDAYYYADVMVVGADRDSFKVLNLLHAKDKSHVYYASARHVAQIPGADPGSFELVGPAENRGKDANREYLRGQPVK